MQNSVDSHIFKPWITLEDIKKAAQTKVCLTQTQITECLAAQEEILSRAAPITDPNVRNEQMI